MVVLQIKILVYQKATFFCLNISTHEPFLIFCCSFWQDTFISFFFSSVKPKVSFHPFFHFTHNICVWWYDIMMWCFRIWYDNLLKWYIQNCTSGKNGQMEYEMMNKRIPQPTNQIFMFAYYLHLSVSQHALITYVMDP